MTKRCQIGEGAVHDGQVLVGDGNGALRQIIAPAILEACSANVIQGKLEDCSRVRLDDF